MLNYLRTPGGIHLVINGKPVAVAKSDKHFEAVVEALKRKATAEEILDLLESEKRRMEAAVQVAPGIEIKGGQLYYENEPVAGVLGERMSQMLDEGFDLTPMAMFLQNLMQNPSMRVVEHLYGFLEHGHNPITDDGCFLAYKAVRDNYKDIHSGTFDNSIGQVVKMPRNRVNEDPNQTCSAGLHVCSYDYLPHFSHANGHVMVCKINPANVVAVPTDYYNTKMRVCEYEVVGEYEGYYKNEGDTLSATSVATDTDANFVVDVDYGSGYSRDGDYERLSEAADRMEDLLDDSDVARVRIVNVKTGQTADERDNEDYEGDGGGDADPSYTIFGIQSGGGRIQLQDGYDSLPDAVMDALDYDNGTYARIEVVDQDGNIAKTLS
jgi:hypothetical protein